MKFGAQNQYDRVIYPLIGNFAWSKKKYTFGGQKGENKPSKPKNGIWCPKNQNRTAKAQKILELG
jgi:hypothetical protein